MKTSKTHKTHHWRDRDSEFSLPLITIVVEKWKGWNLHPAFAIRYRYRNAGGGAGNITIRAPCSAVGHGSMYHSQSVSNSATNMFGSTMAAMAILMGKIMEDVDTAWYSMKLMGIIHRCISGIPQFETNSRVSTRLLQSSADRAAPQDICCRPRWSPTLPTAQGWRSLSLEGQSKPKVYCLRQFEIPIQSLGLMWPIVT